MLSFPLEPSSNNWITSINAPISSFQSIFAGTLTPSSMPPIINTLLINALILAIKILLSVACWSSALSIPKYVSASNTTSKSNPSSPWNASTFNKSRITFNSDSHSQYTGITTVSSTPISTNNSSNNCGKHALKIWEDVSVAISSSDKCWIVETLISILNPSSPWNTSILKISTNTSNSVDQSIAVGIVIVSDNPALSSAVLIIISIFDMKILLSVKIAISSVVNCVNASGDFNLEILNWPASSWNASTSNISITTPSSSAHASPVTIVGIVTLISEPKPSTNLANNESTFAKKNLDSVI